MTAPKDCPKVWSASPHQGTQLTVSDTKAERFAKYEAKLRKLLRDAQQGATTK